MPLPRCKSPPRFHGRYTHIDSPSTNDYASSRKCDTASQNPPVTIAVDNTSLSIKKGHASVYGLALAKIGNVALVRSPSLGRSEVKFIVKVVVLVGTRTPSALGARAFPKNCRVNMIGRIKQVNAESAFGGFFVSHGF